MSNSVVVASAGQGVMVTNDQTGRTNLVPGVVLIDPATGLPYAGGGGGGGSVTVDTSTLTKEATQLQVRDELVSIDGKTPALVGGAVPVAGPVTDAQLRAAAVPVSAATLPLPTGAATAARQDTANAAFGAPADARAAWYDSAASVIQLLKLSVAAFVGAGSRTYTYTAGVLTSEAWTLFGTTRTKTYGYTNGVLTSESDWV